MVRVRKLGLGRVHRMLEMGWNQLLQASCLPNIWAYFTRFFCCCATHISSGTERLKININIFIIGLFIWIEKSLGKILKKKGTLISSAKEQFCDVGTILRKRFMLGNLNNFR